MPDFFDKIKQELKQKGEVVIHCRVIPGASRSEIKEVMVDGVIKIAIAAPPEKGKANRELIKFLSREFRVSRGNVEIISGRTARNKLVRLTKVL